jgi:hypothetical protein
MSAGVTISYGGTSVDFNSATCNNVKVGYRSTNPIIAISTPISSPAVIGSNTIPINLGMVNNSFDLSFMLMDGPGSFNFTTPGSTNFEKLGYLQNYVRNAKILTLNGTSFYGQLESLNVPWEGGKSNLSVLGTLTFHCTANIAME